MTCIRITAEHCARRCLTEYTSVLTVREDQEVEQQAVRSGRVQDEMQAINLAVIGEVFCVFLDESKLRSEVR